MHMLLSTEARVLATLAAFAGGAALLLAALLRARHSRHPAILYTCGAYLLLLHAVWIWGLWGEPYFASAFGTLTMLTFPWSFVVTTNISMAGFGTLRALGLNYARFVLGFGGLQCLLLTLFVWELKLAPRARSAARFRSPRA